MFPYIQRLVFAYKLFNKFQIMVFQMVFFVLGVITKLLQSFNSKGLAAALFLNYFNTRLFSKWILIRHEAKKRGIAVIL
jgi:hypothetical protein